MTWTYRVIRDEHGGHRIAEVYNGLPEAIRWTVDPIAPYGDTLNELRADMGRMLRAFDHPVLNEATLRETVASETPKR